MTQAPPSPLVILALAHAADFLLTWLWLDLGGQEGNPLAAGIIASWGVAAIVPVKLANVGCFWLITSLAHGTPMERPSRILTWTAVVLLAGVVAWNTAILAFHFWRIL